MILDAAVDVFSFLDGDQVQWLLDPEQTSLSALDASFLDPLEQPRAV